MKANMYSSLNRIDMELNPGKNPVRTFLQTDHRTADEVAQAPELSKFFALVRILVAKHGVGTDQPEPVVFYSAVDRPPQFLCRVIQAAGGRLMVGDDLQEEAFNHPPEDLQLVINEVCSDLALLAAVDFKVNMTEAGLAEMEAAFATRSLDPATDEAGYWAAAAQLGCFAGELIRQANGGSWLVDGQMHPPIGFLSTFDGKTATAFPFNRAVKFLANGEEDSLVPFVGLFSARGRRRGAQSAPAI